MIKTYNLLIFLNHNGDESIMITIKTIILMGGLGFLVFNEVGILQLISDYKQNKIKQNELDNEYIKIKNLTNEIYKLENDSEYIEKIAREEFRMAAPGEKIYKVEDEKHTNN